MATPQEQAGLVYSTVEEIPQINADLRKVFLTHKTRDLGE